MTSTSTAAVAAPSVWLVDIANPPGAQTLSLATKDWQRFEFGVQAVLFLPPNTSDQVARYGSPDRIPGLQGFFDAADQLALCARNYGSPKALRAQILADPNFLTTDGQPMNDWLSGLMWILQSTARTSFTIAEIFRNIPATAAGISTTEVIDGIQELFAPVFDQMQVQADQLATSVTTLNQLGTAMSSASFTMTSFTAKTSDLVKTVNQQIGDLRASMDDYAAKARTAYDEMIGFAATAGVTGVLAFVGAAVTCADGPAAPVTAGATAALAATSATMSGLALAASDSYESLLEKIKNAKKEEFQDLTLKNDLSAIDNTCKFDLPSVSSTSTALSSMQRAWTASLNNLQNAVSQLAPDTLEGGPWLDPASTNPSHDSWAALSSAIDYFIAGGIVDSVFVPFGDPLPPQPT